MKKSCGNLIKLFLVFTICLTLVIQYEDFQSLNNETEDDGWYSQDYEEPLKKMV